jgi:hypothetical protein
MSTPITFPSGLPLSLSGSLPNVLGAGATVGSGQLMSLLGGTLTGNLTSPIVSVLPGGTLAGFGTVATTNGGISDAGTIVASGGTLLLNGVVSGAGTLGIAANSTAEINGPTLGNVGVVFNGQGASLDLSQGVIANGVLQDFGLGDTIMMPYVTGTAYNATDNILTMTDAGKVVDQLHFAGNYQGSSFKLSQTGTEAVISFSAVHT